MTENNQTTASTKSNFFFGFFTGLAIFGIIGFFSLSFLLNKQKSANTNTNNENQAANQEGSRPENSGPKVIGSSGTFSKTDKEICKDGKKPIIRLFSTSTCSHCVWVKDIFDKVAKEYVDKGKIAAYHWELDTNDNLLTKTKETAVPDSEIQLLTEFNPEGYVPAFVFGCQYFRIGTGYERENDLKKEGDEFRKIIDSLLE